MDVSLKITLLPSGIHQPVAGEFLKIQRVFLSDVYVWAIMSCMEITIFCGNKKLMFFIFVSAIKRMPRWNLKVRDMNGEISSSKLVQSSSDKTQVLKES